MAFCPGLRTRSFETADLLYCSERVDWKQVPVGRTHIWEVIRGIERMCLSALSAQPWASEAKQWVGSLWKRRRRNRAARAA
jgi:hypothetical protein